MVFNATFNNISVISWLSILLVEETEVPGENHRPAARHWQTLSHNVVWVSNYHTITTMMAPFLINAVCLAEKQLIPIYSLVWPDHGSNPQSIALEASTLTITPLIFHNMITKWWPFNTGYCLIKVTAWIGLTVFINNVNNLIFPHCLQLYFIKVF